MTKILWDGAARQGAKGQLEETGHARISLLPLSQLKHPPENDVVYRRIDPADPEVRALAKSIAKHGVKEPLIVSLDDYILSGNRRAVASQLAKLTEVPCLVESIRHSDPRFLQLLTECNRQRVKSAEEMAREAIIGVDPDHAYQRLRQYREARARDVSAESLSIDIEGIASRSAISKAKMPMLNAAIAIIRSRRQFWPLTTRQVHYGLLNDPPLRHASKPQSRYANNRNCYNDLCDLLLRARLEGMVCWEAIDDPTRPITVWNVQQNVGPFVRDQLDDFLMGYARDLQQGQPLHIEVVGEKNTIGNVIRPVCADYTIPYTLGRGYCSGSPRKKLAERFHDSGRDRLALLVISDFDPEGEDIPHVFARSLRDEFGCGDVLLVKVALTAQQVEEMNLPPVMSAKEGSSRRERFVEANGETVHELEAIPPDRLQQLLRDAIESVMDVEAFHAEQAREREDAATLERIRRAYMNAAESGGFDADSLDEDGWDDDDEFDEGGDA